MTRSRQNDRQWPHPEMAMGAGLALSAELDVGLSLPFHDGNLIQYFTQSDFLCPASSSCYHLHSEMVF